MTDLLDAPDVVAPPPDRRPPVVGLVVAGAALVAAGAAGYGWVRSVDVLPTLALATAVGALALVAVVALAAQTGRRIPLVPAGLTAAAVAVGGAVVAGEVTGGLPPWNLLPEDPLVWRWLLRTLGIGAPALALVAVLTVALGTVRLRGRPAPAWWWGPAAAAVVATAAGAGVLVAVALAPSADLTPADEVAGVVPALEARVRTAFSTTSVTQRFDHASDDPTTDDEPLTVTSSSTGWFDLDERRGETVTPTTHADDPWIDAVAWGEDVADVDRMRPWALEQLLLAVHAVPSWQATTDGTLVGTVDGTRAVTFGARHMGVLDGAMHRYAHDAGTFVAWPATEVRLVLADDGTPATLTVTTRDEHVLDTTTIEYAAP